jgi:hypothetical protein
MRLRTSQLLSAAFLLAGAASATAGMPAPLPTDFEVRTALRWDESALDRLRAISFFLLGLLLCAAAVRWLWNYLGRDFSALPRLGYGKALAGVVLWGLLFVVVLTMVAGARELMTPGAWRKQGFTYRPTPGPAPAADQGPGPRERRLEEWRTALWRFAATHGGRFPSPSELTAVPPELWEVPGGAGLRYHYVAGLSAVGPARPLVCEPELERGRRLVLQTSGEIVRRDAAELEQALARGEKP